MRSGDYLASGDSTDIRKAVNVVDLIKKAKFEEKKEKSFDLSCQKSSKQKHVKRI